MRTAYFFSGFDPVAGFPSEVSDNLHKDIVNRDMLLFISSSPFGHEKSDKHMAGTIRWFEQAGICFAVHRLLDDRADAAQALDWVHRASCIFLMGGDTLAQITYIKDNGFLSAIRNSRAVVMGISAGAINMAKTSLCTKDKYTPKTVMYEGIGVADVTIEPHFTLDNWELIAELDLISQQHPIYAMCDGSAIIVRGESIVYIGDIHRIDKSQMKRIGA